MGRIAYNAKKRNCQGKFSKVVSGMRNTSEFEYFDLFLIYFLFIFLNFELFFFKGCVHYLNRCTTSPMCILHQLNEKKRAYNHLSHLLWP